MKNKHKRIIAISLLGLIVVTIGGTIAYNTDWSVFGNLFKIGYWRTQFVETFDSPDNWQPCEEIPKTVIAKNTGTVEAKARLSIEDFWKIAGSTSTDHESELPNVRNDITLAQILFQNEDDWTLKDGYYYWNGTLKPGEETNSLLKAVKLDCSANFGGTNVCTETETGRVCEKPADEYEGAKYHVYVTVEMIQADAAEEAWGLKRDTLYDVVANQSNGSDSGVNFSAASTVAGGNGNGVNTVASTLNDEFPIHYYRGEVENNNVLLEGMCWLIVRTDKNGSVKLIYDGQPTEGVCPRTYEKIGSQQIGRYPFSSDGSSLAGMGYMYGDDYHLASDELSGSVHYGEDSDVWTVSVSGNDVSWDGSKYKVKNPKKTSSNSTLLENYLDGYRYMCVGDTTATSCEQVWYIAYTYNGNVHGIKLSGGKKAEDAMDDMRKNTHDSAMKTTIENWFEGKINAQEKLTDIEDNLEDVVFCNDREISYGPFLGSSFKLRMPFENDIFAGPMRTVYTQWGISNMSSYARMDEAENVAPKLGCARADDRFTKDAANGNGKLKHKVGLITADELLLSGFAPQAGSSGLFSASSAYIESYYHQFMWTMTPGYINSYGGGPSAIYFLKADPAGDVMADASGADSSLGVRPMIAVKHDSFVKSGDGSATDPYVLEWEN